MKKIIEKVAVGIIKSRSSENFQGTHIWGALRGHLCDSTGYRFLVIVCCGVLIRTSSASDPDFASTYRRHDRVASDNSVMGTINYTVYRVAQINWHHFSVFTSRILTSLF